MAKAVVMTQLKEEMAKTMGSPPAVNIVTALDALGEALSDEVRDTHYEI